MEAAPRDATIKIKTGDAVADGWEEEILKTGTFDPMKVLSPEDKNRLANFLKRVAQGAGNTLGTAPKINPRTRQEPSKPVFEDPFQFPDEGIHERFDEG